MTIASNNFDSKYLHLLSYWIRERESIRKKKDADCAPPWTADEILGTYRFCNAHREDDRVTRWIATYWRTPNARDPNLWHAMLIARYINWPDSLIAMGYPEPWPDKVKQATYQLQQRQLRLQKVFTGAYIVSTNGEACSKLAYVLGLFDRAWNMGNRIKKFPIASTLAETHANLMLISGVGSFMAAQIVADLKYVQPLLSAKDWTEWCAPGPGSLRGLNRVLNLPITTTWKPQRFTLALQALRKEIKKTALDNFDDLQDLQNCLCEFDKYLRTKLGKGRPRSRYAPPAAQQELPL